MLVLLMMDMVSMCEERDLLERLEMLLWTMLLLLPDMLLISSWHSSLSITSSLIFKDSIPMLIACLYFSTMVALLLVSGLPGVSFPSGVGGGVNVDSFSIF